MTKKEFFLIIVIIILILTIFIRNNNNNIKLNKISNEIEIVETTRLKLKDSLIKEIQYNNTLNKDFKSTINNLKTEILHLKQKSLKQPKNKQETVNYNIERYNESTIIKDSLICISESNMNKIIYDLEKGDIAIKTLPLLDSVVNYQDSIIVNLEDNYLNLNSILLKTEDELILRKNYQIKLENKNKNNKFIVAGTFILAFILVLLFLVIKKVYLFHL
jgi:hypothetical protein